MSSIVEKPRLALGSALALPSAALDRYATGDDSAFADVLWVRRGSDPVHPRLTAAGMATAASAGAWVLVDLQQSKLVTR
jgi:hypothetical protein